MLTIHNKQIPASKIEHINKKEILLNFKFKFWRKLIHKNLNIFILFAFKRFVF